MKARFYSKNGTLVWECTKDAIYEFNNGTKAMLKGAVKAVLLTPDGEELGEMYYRPFSKLVS